MLKFHFNHSDNGKGFFGMLANRLIFDGKSDGERPGTATDVMAQAEAAKGALETQRADTKKALESYAAKEKGKPYERVLAADFLNKPADGIAAVDALMAEKFEFEVTKGKKTETQEKALKDITAQEAPALFEHLTNLKLVREELVALAGLTEDTDKGKATTELAKSSAALVEGMEYTRARASEKNLWKDKKVYKDATDQFELAISNPLFSGGSDRFKEFWTTENENFSAPRQNKSKDLFFAILAEQTNNFEDGACVLGKDFGNDHDVNRRNYPFIYEQWLAFRGVNEAHINEMSARVDQLDALATPLDDLFGPNYDTTPIASELTQLKGLSEEPPVSYLKEKVSLLGRMRSNLEGYKGTDAQKDVWRKTAKSLTVHIELSEQKIRLLQALDDKEGKSHSFTRAELLANPQMAMELAMRQFGEAMKVVDKPLKNGEWGGTLDPSIRRLLIAQAYEAGVSEVSVAETGGGEGKIVEAQQNRHAMLLKIIQSKEFSDKNVEAQLTENQSSMLEMLRFANVAEDKMAVLKETTLPFLEKLKVIKDKREAKEDSSAEEAELAKKYPAALIDAYLTDSADTIGKKLEDAQADLAKYEAFVKDANDALSNPEKAVAFMATLRNGTYENNKLSADVNGGGARFIVNSKEFTNMEGYLKKTDISYRTIELDSRNKMDYLRTLGIRTEGLYEGYALEIKNKPELNVENWDDLLHGSSADKLKLLGLMKKLVKGQAETRNNGADHFLTVFESLLKDGDTNPPTGTAKSYAFEIYTLLKGEIRGKAGRKAGEGLAVEQINKKMRGFTLAEKASKIIDNVMEMFNGTWPEKMAGFILAIGAFKLAKKAWKGEGADGKLLRGIFVAGAVETYLEKQGRGLTEMLGFNTLSEALEGTYKGVLQQNGKEFMEKNGVSDKEHGAALVALDNVPFDKAMAWYKGADAQGGGADDLFGAMGMNTRNIEKAWGTGFGMVADNRKSSERQKQARRAIYFTMQHAFDYIGKKDDQDFVKSQKALEERYITLVKHPDAEPVITKFKYSKEFYKELANHKEELTWAGVISKEIGVQNVLDTERQNNVDKIADMVGEKASAVSEWFRENVIGYGEVYAANLFADMGDSARDFKAFLTEAVISTKEKATFLKDKVVFKYRENEMELKRLAYGHFELLATGVSLPFKVMFATDKFAIPWLQTKLRQVSEILELNNSKSFEDKTAFTDTDFEGPQAELRFGPMFMESFKKANNATPEKYFNDNGIGYFITEVTLDDVGLRSDADSTQKNAEMVKKSWDEAQKNFANKSPGLTDENFARYLYAVHSFRSGNPEKLYTFWRMPLVGSSEYNMKEEGRWADSMLPSKDTPPFVPDTSEGVIKNLQKVLYMNTGPTRTLVNGAASYLFQLPHAGLSALSGLAGIGEVVGTKAFPKYKKEITNTAEMLRSSEKTKQMLDEYATAAKSPELAYSAFYNDPENSQIYALLLAHAYKEAQPLYTGIFLDSAFAAKGKGKEGYQATSFSQEKGSFKYDGPRGLKAFYKDVWLKDHTPIKKFDSMIGKMKDE